MLELLITGPEATQQQRRELIEGETVRLGRAPRSGWSVPWDLLISREHCEVELHGGLLQVKRLESARNPIYLDEVDTREFGIIPGQGFRIGQTLFQLVSVEVSDGLSGSKIEEQSFAPEVLRRFKFHNAEQRLEVLTKLPDAISKARTDKDLSLEVIKILLKAMPHATGAAVVQYPPHPGPDDKPILMNWDTQKDEVGRFSPSRRLMTGAINRNEGVLHVWQDTQESNPAFTLSGNLDWAFCLPLKGESSRGWAVYVSGKFGGPGSSSITENDIKGDLRFTELVCDFISSIRSVKSLQQQQAGMAQFFSPAVMEAVRKANSDKVLEPRESDITVLFCDVRGFSKKAEAAQENLKQLLDRVSDALGVMTAGIIKYDGVIADFQGDAALGFWGWPNLPEDGPIAACRAALHIQQEFLRAIDNPQSPLAGFKVGIGVAHGRAIAGKIGTQEQIKVGAFGPVVNMGSRLEGLTKQLRTSILIDELTGKYVRQHAKPDEMRCRKIGRFIPAGMNTDLEIYELLPPVAVDGRVSDQQIATYERAVDSFIKGQWQSAMELLNELPVDDRVKDFLLIYIATNNYEAPPDWAGVIRMDKK